MTSAIRTSLVADLLCLMEKRNESDSGEIIDTRLRENLQMREYEN